jgi:NAD(P)H-dependent FMN reductase
VRILLLAGSTRAAASTTAVLRTAAAVAPGGAEGVLWTRLTELPHFDPDDDVEPLPAEVAALRAAIAGADAILVGTPEYAGALPGAFKNLLDWTVGGTETTDVPCGWINASGRPNGAAGAHAELRTVLGYTGCVVIDAACVTIPVSSANVVDGEVRDPATRTAIAEVLATLAAATRS